MREFARALWRRTLPLAVLVVAALPGTTSASFAPVSPIPDVSADAIVDPILIELSEGDLLRSPVGVDPAARPAAEDAPRPFAIDNPSPGSVFDEAQVISIYGYPGICVMGEIGCHDHAGAVASLRDITADYERLNVERETGRSVRAALHLIVDVAQPRPQPDGSYLARMSLEEVAQWVELAREEDLLIFLDLQIGWTEPLSGVQRLEEFLVEPFVHLALDAEFATEMYGQPPGSVIGTLDAPDVNAVQAYLAELVRAHGLPPKIFVLHQFTPRMLINTDAYEDLPEVDLTITMDGYGPPSPKIGGYERYALADYSQRPGFKLFFHWDEPLMSPAEVMDLAVPPDYVIYQ